MIEVENLVKKYGGHLAVDHLTFKVEKGQIYGFLGPNGAGKSTTMNMITGYLAATEGSIKVNGFDVLGEPEKAKRSIGYLPEIPPLYTDMTVFEYLKFVAELKGVKKAERNDQVSEVMEMTGISDMKNRLIGNLSKGYKQRIGFSQAILGKPEVLILDEPTVGLDPKQIIEIRELIKKLGKQHTIILSSHILSEISAVCDHIMIISKGKLVASDATDKLIQKIGKKVNFLIEIEEDREKAEEILQNISEITSIEWEENGKKAHILAEDNCDIRKALFFAFAKEKMPLLGLEKTESSLEDVFLEVTSVKREEEEA